MKMALDSDFHESVTVTRKLLSEMAYIADEVLTRVTLLENIIAESEDDAPATVAALRVDLGVLRDKSNGVLSVVGLPADQTRFEDVVFDDAEAAAEINENSHSF